MAVMGSPAQGLVRESPAPMFVTGSDGTLLTWNAAMAELMAVPESAALRRKCWEVLSGRAPDSFSCSPACAVLETAQTGWSPTPVELVVGRRTRQRRRPDGRARRVAIHHVALSGRELAPGIVVHLVEDVDERRRRERIGERLEALATGTGPLDLPLTPREREIARHMVHGLSARQIAERMGIRHATARSGLQRLLGKLGAHSRVGALLRLVCPESIERPCAPPEP